MSLSAWEGISIIFPGIESLLVINFNMSEKVEVILPSFLRDIFMAYRILHDRLLLGFFFLSVL